MSRSKRVALRFKQAGDFLVEGYAAPNTSPLSVLPNYGVSNANIPRGEDGYIMEYLERKALLKESGKLDEHDLKYWNLNRFLQGGWTTLYHGTVASFDKFDMSYVRQELVDGFYGGGIFLTPSEEIAWEYAQANRNFGLPKTIIQDISRQHAEAGAFLSLVYKLGYEKGWEALIQSGYQYGDTLNGFDPQDISDLAPYIIGAKEPVSLTSTIFGGALIMPDYVYDFIDDLGLDSTVYKPKVYVVVGKANKVLITDNMSEAKRAPTQGYDGVIYFGSATVRGVPEVAIHNPKNIRILRVITE